VHAYSPAQPDPGSTILPQALAGALTARQKDPANAGTWLVVIIDACHSARFAALLDAQSRHRPDGPDNFMIVGVSGDGPTRLGRFTGVLERCLRNTFRANDQISVWDLAGELSRRLLHGEVAVRRVHDGTLVRRTPVAALNAPLDVLDLLETALAALSDDERRHYLAKAQGGDGLFTATGELSWYFQGRRHEARVIVDWLDASRGGMLVVTGPPGCGKSALLGHLLIHTRRALREILTRARVLEVDPAVPRPPDDVFDAALLLTGATIPDVLSRLAAALGFGVLPQVDPNRQVRWLCQRLVERAATRPVTLMVDALDEAIAPVTMARTVLAVLADIPGVRLVVGTRRSTTEGPDQPDPDNRDLLDALAHRRPPTILVVPREAAAIGGYLRQRLRTALGAAAERHTTVMEALCDRVVGSDREFLYARLLVHEVIAGPEVLEPAGDAARDTLLRRDHQGLFVTAVDRLSTMEPRYRAVLEALGLAQGRGLPIRDGIWATTADALQGSPLDPLTTAGSPVDDATLDALLIAAAPYVMLDTEAGQTVYRLAHRTFAEHFAAGAEVRHLAILAAWTSYGAQRLPDNPYLRHHLVAHAHAGGIQGWDLLADRDDVLDWLDSDSVLVHVMAVGVGQLPAAVAAFVVMHDELRTAASWDRTGLRQIGMARLGQTRPADGTHAIVPWRVRLAKLSSSTPHLAMTGHAGWVRSVAVLPRPTGRHWLATGGDDGTVRLWDPNTGRPVGPTLIGHTGPVYSVVALPRPDGWWLVTGSAKGSVRLWDPDSGTPVGSVLTGHTGPVSSIVVLPRPDGRHWLVSGGYDGTVRLWDPGSGTLIGSVLTGHTGPVNAVAVLPRPDGRHWLVSGGYDGTVRLWDIGTGTPVGSVLTSDHGRVSSVVVLPRPSGRHWLVTGGAGGLIRLWDAESGKPVGSVMTGLTDGVYSMVVLPRADGRHWLVVSGPGGTVRFWDPDTGTQVGPVLTGDASRVYSVVLLPRRDGRHWLATAGNDATVRLWDPDTGAPVGPLLTGHTDSVSSVTALPRLDGRWWLITAGSGGEMRLWDLGTAIEIERTMTDFPRWELLVAVLPRPDGGVWVAFGNGSTVRLWDPDNGTPVGSALTVRTGLVKSVAVLPRSDGRWCLATGMYDGSVRLWDLNSGTSVGPVMTGHTREVTSMVVLSRPDGGCWLATGGHDRTVRLWDPDTATQVGPALTELSGPVCSVAVLPRTDGRRWLVIGAVDGTVRLWDPDTGATGPLLGLTGRAYSVAVLPRPSGRCWLATGGVDGTVRLWDPDTAAFLQFIPLTTAVNALAAVPGGLAVGTDIGFLVIELDDLEPEPSV